MTRNMGSQAASVCVTLPCRVQPGGSGPAELGLGPARLWGGGGQYVLPERPLRGLVSLY